MDKGLMDTTVNSDMLLARIDERTNSISQRLEHIEGRLERQFVTTAQFNPVRNLVFGGIGLVLTTVILAIIRLVTR